MNDPSNNAGSPGRLTRLATQSRGLVTVDCSTWDAEAPDAPWSSGKLRSVPRPSPPIVPGPFLAAGALQLEIALEIDPGTNPAEALTAATALVAAVFTHDLAHGLTYDPTRTRADATRAVIALVLPQPEPTAEARLEKLADVIRKVINEASGIGLGAVRVLRAA